MSQSQSSKKTFNLDMELSNKLGDSKSQIIQIETKQKEQDQPKTDQTFQKENNKNNEKEQEQEKINQDNKPKKKNATAFLSKFSYFSINLFPFQYNQSLSYKSINGFFFTLILLALSYVIFSTYIDKVFVSQDYTVEASQMSYSNENYDKIIQNLAFNMNTSDIYMMMEPDLSKKIGKDNKNATLGIELQVITKDGFLRGSKFQELSDDCNQKKHLRTEQFNSQTLQFDISYFDLCLHNFGDSQLRIDPEDNIWALIVVKHGTFDLSTGVIDTTDVPPTPTTIVHMAYKTYNIDLVQKEISQVLKIQSLDNHLNTYDHIKLSDNFMYLRSAQYTLQEIHFDDNIFSTQYTIERNIKHIKSQQSAKDEYMISMPQTQAIQEEYYILGGFIIRPDFQLEKSVYKQVRYKILDAISGSISLILGASGAITGVYIGLEQTLAHKTSKKKRGEKKTKTEKKVVPIDQELNEEQSDRNKAEYNNEVDKYDSQRQIKQQQIDEEIMEQQQQESDSSFIIEQEDDEENEYFPVLCVKDIATKQDLQRMLKYIQNKLRQIEKSEKIRGSQKQIELLEQSYAKQESLQREIKPHLSKEGTSASNNEFANYLLGEGEEELIEESQTQEAKKQQEV